MPGPVSVPVPQYNYNVPGVNSATGWMWDTSEGVLISDTGVAVPTQNVYRVGQFDVHGVVGGMAYGAAFGAPSPEVWYQPGPEHEQLNPAWFPHVQLDGMHHHGGTGVYLQRMDYGAGAQTQGGGATGYTAGPMVGVGGPDYQLVPAVASPVAAWTSAGGIMVSAGRTAEAWEAAYSGEHVYYV